MWSLLALLLSVSEVPSSKAAPEYVTQARKIQEACESRLVEIYSQEKKELQAATTADERQAAEEKSRQEAGPLRLESAQRVLGLAEPHAAETESVAFLIWAANLATEDVRRPAIDLLTRHHLTDAKTIEYALRHRFILSPCVESLLRELSASTDLPPDQRPQIMRALGESLQKELEIARRVQGAGEDDLPLYLRNWPQTRLDEWKALDLSQLEAETIDVFTRLGRDYAQQRLRPNFETTFGDIAKSSIFEIQNRDAPFALVGVNADLEKDKLDEIMAKEGITWRSFSSGEKGPAAPLPRSWNVNGWPTLYLIDGKGIIRAKNIHDATLDAELEKLVQEARKGN